MIHSETSPVFATQQR